MTEKAFRKGMCHNQMSDTEKEAKAIRADQIKGMVLDKVKVGDHFSLEFDIRSSGISTNGRRATVKPGEYTILAFYPNHILTERIDKLSKEKYDKIFEDEEQPTIDWRTESLRFNPPSYTSKESFTYMELYQIINKQHFALGKEEIE